MKKLFFILLILLLPAQLLAANYYVDPTTASTTNDGSFAHPFKTRAHIAAKSFSTGDSLYFKVGTTLTVTDSIYITWSGAEGNRVTIGAYYGENQFGLNGNARPIIDGQNTYPISNDRGMIEAWNRAGWITVRDLHIKDSYAGGVRIGQAWTSSNDFTQYNQVINCYFERIGRSAIMWPRSSYGLIEDNTIIGSNERCVVNYAGNCVNDGAAVEITGMGTEEVTRENVVRGNTITESYETIGVYKGAWGTLIESNTLYGFGRVGVYLTNSRNSTVRYNVIYEPSNSLGGRRSLIWIDNESHLQTEYNWIGGHEIHDNYLAGGLIAIRMGCQTNAQGLYNSNNNIYNNRIVDNDYNFRFYNNVEGWTNNQIYDNYSYIFTDGLVHTSAMSPYGITWSGNTYNTDIVTVTGSAATTATLAANASLGASALATTTGWRALVAGAVDADDFLFSGETTTDPEPDPDPTLDSGNALTTGLTRAYIFDEGSGTSAFDHTANDAHMTLTNPSWSTLGLTMSSAGQVAAASVPAFGDSFSIFMAYTSTGTVSQDYAKFLYYYNANVRDLQIERFTSDTEIRSDIGGTTDNTVAWTPVTDTFDQKFHTLLLTYDRTGGNRCLYINGSLQSCSGSTWTNPTFTGNMYLGGKSDGTRVVGATYHAFYTWSSVLTAADALSLQNDYDQMFLSPPARTFAVPPPGGAGGRGYIDGTLPKAIIDSTKPLIMWGGH